MWEFSTKAKARSSSEAEDKKLVAATKQFKGDADSEAAWKQIGWPRKLGVLDHQVHAEGCRALGT